MNIVFTDKKRVLLNTGLTETAFSKSTHGINFSESGLLVRFNLFENNFQFAPWSFSGTTVETQDGKDFVCFEGEAFSGATALSVITGQDKDKAARLTFALSRTYSKVIDTKTALPCVGLGGIFYNEKISKKNAALYQIELLFLPEFLFDFSASNFGEKDYSLNQGYWQNKALTGNNYHIFTQGVLLYRSLAEIFPFMKTQTQARQEDIIDSNFIEIENLVNGINRNLAANINMCFHIDNQYERDKTLINSDLLKAELGLNDDGTVTPVERKSKLSQNAFEQKLKKKEKSKNLKIMQKRLIKKYSAVIIISLIAFIAAFRYGKNIYMDSLKKPVAKTLTATEAIETFYSGFHQLDTPLMHLVAKGPDTTEIINMITTIYVAGCTRIAYESKCYTITPELYLTRPELVESWVFGITDFKIDGKPAYNRFMPISKDQYKTLKKQGQVRHLKNGITETHTVTYNMVYSSGTYTPYTVTRCTSSITCTYIKDQWYITDVKTENTESKYQQELFLNDYTASYKAFKDPKLAVQAMREKYDWLPDQRAMDDAEKIADYQKNYFN